MYLHLPTSISTDCKLKSDSIEIVSMSSRQYYQAKKPIKEILSGKLLTSSATSIVFRALSTGVYAVKREIAAHAIYEAICKFNYASDSVKDIRIVILDEPTCSCFALMLL